MFSMYTQNENIGCAFSFFSFYGSHIAKLILVTGKHFNQSLVLKRMTICITHDVALYLPERHIFSSMTRAIKTFHLLTPHSDTSFEISMKREIIHARLLIHKFMAYIYRVLLIFAVINAIPYGNTSWISLIKLMHSYRTIVGM